MINYNQTVLAKNINNYEMHLTKAVNFCGAFKVVSLFNKF